LYEVKSYIMDINDLEYLFDQEELDSLIILRAFASANVIKYVKDSDLNGLMNLYDELHRYSFKISINDIKYSSTDIIKGIYTVEEHIDPEGKTMLIRHIAFKTHIDVFVHPVIFIFIASKLGLYGTVYQNLMEFNNCKILNFYQKY